ncbi:hypothetical protein [Desulfonatronum thiodismutans]|uniref:hypothetical protein n=1 Tax=Desulfonatronum thiodismutans TaxID=159290 RepID=UPI0004ABE686|nr:hypothetical protein [Desulfonatronum thiodismutans]
MDFVLQKIRDCESTIQGMESKHGCDFERFSAMLREKADLSLEDDWLDWMAAMELRQAWKSVSISANSSSKVEFTESGWGD